MSDSYNYMTTIFVYSLSHTRFKPLGFVGWWLSKCLAIALRFNNDFFGCSTTPGSFYRSSPTLTEPKPAETSGTPSYNFNRPATEEHGKTGVKDVDKISSCGHGTQRPSRALPPLRDEDEDAQGRRSVADILGAQWQYWREPSPWWTPYGILRGSYLLPSKKNGVLGEGCWLTYFYIFLASR